MLRDVSVSNPDTGKGRFVVVGQGFILARRRAAAIIERAQLSTGQFGLHFDDLSKIRE